MKGDKRRDNNENKCGRAGKKTGQEEEKKKRRKEK
jgi:hypothetical protein